MLAQRHVGVCFVKFLQWRRARSDRWSSCSHSQRLFDSWTVKTWKYVSACSQSATRMDFLSTLRTCEGEAGWTSTELIILYDSVWVALSFIPRWLTGKFWLSICFYQPLVCGPFLPVLVFLVLLGSQNHHCVIRCRSKQHLAVWLVHNYHGLRGSCVGGCFHLKREKCWAVMGYYERGSWYFLLHPNSFS